jgi:HK97 family phage portal protein
MKIPFTNIEIRSSKRPRPDDWDDHWYSRNSYENKTGIDVNEDLAMQFSVVWSCIKVISEDLASLPLHLYRREGDVKQKATDQWLYYLLHDQPNPEMTTMQFREALTAHLLTYGNCYSEIERDMRGQVKALWPLNPSKMTVIRPEKELIYEYRMDNGEKKLFSRGDILHVAGLGFNGLVGYSPISYQRELIGAGLSARDWQSSNYKNGGRLQLAFTHPAAKAPNPEGRKHFKDEIRKEYGGPEGNAIAVLWEGMKVEPISMTMEDAQFIESRKLTRSEICGIYRVPPHKIMDLERATFSNIEHQALEYVIDAIRPWAVRWEQAINSRLLNGSSKFVVEHNVDGLLRGDIKSRYDAYAVGKQWGWLNSNEIREKENMNPIDGGDVYLQPLNMTKLGEFPEPANNQLPEAPLTDEEIKQAASAIRKLRLIRGQ